MLMQNFVKLSANTAVGQLNQN